MISISNKAKQFLILVIKIIIVLGAFYFIYDQFASNKQLNWLKFKKVVIKNVTLWNFLFILLLSFLNRFFEILKWQNLIDFIKPISLGEATKQVLGALTAGLFTPNGIGEYAGKALFYEKVQTKKIIFLNLICNGSQMILSVFFGTIGLFYLGYYFEILVSFGILVIVIIIGYALKNLTIRGYSLEKLIKRLNDIPKNIHQKNFALSVGRYIIFSHQYYFLFLIFDVQLPYFIMMATIMTVYFLASSLPSFQFFDFAVKGSVALYFFGLLGVNNWIVLFISTLMWLLNVVIPVIIGSYYVFKFKPQWKS